jgi:glycosyltransferase involved in cell wall biosynthesis
MHNPKPLVSVIIPTFNRPQFLVRAVNSALAGMDSKDVEIIVVPNGPDQSWRESLANFKNNPSVRVIPILEANANIARNTGMANARGELIRFLDDDDYLISEGAIKQYELIQTSGDDVVSGSVRLVDNEGNCFDIWKQPIFDDFCVAVLVHERICLPPSHLFRKSKIQDFNWNPVTKVRQDVEWLIEVATSQELNWIRIDDAVGVWQQHWDQRISTSTNYNEIRKLTVPMLNKALARLERRNQLSIQRKNAIAQGLLGCVHSAFFLEPKYWAQVINKAKDIDQNARPTQKIYSFYGLVYLDLLLLQWLFFPKRILTFFYRKILKEIRIKHII